MARESKKEKRIAVIKDVFKRLRYLKIKEGSYLSASEYAASMLKISSNDNCQDHINVLQKECRVCAKGALFLSHIRLYDGFTVDEAKVYEGENLEEFDAKNFNLVEVAFELRYTCAYPRYGDEKIKKAIEFGTQFKTPKRRLKAILENMLENDGVFVP